MTSPHAKSRLITGKKSLSQAVVKAIVENETDNITSFGPITDKEAEDFKERLRIDAASIYAT